jgi:hypothetical protein
LIAAKEKGVELTQPALQRLSGALSSLTRSPFVRQASAAAGGQLNAERYYQTPLGQRITERLDRVHRHLPALVGLILFGVVWFVPVYTWIYFFPTEWVCDDFGPDVEPDEDSCVRKR